MLTLSCESAYALGDFPGTSMQPDPDAPGPRSRRRSARDLERGVSLFRWRSGPSAAGVYDIFGAHETGRFGAPEPGAVDAGESENVLLVSASRRVAPDTPAVLLSLVNTSPLQAVRLSVKLAGRAPTSLTGTIVTAPPAASARPRARQASGVPRPIGPSRFQGAVLKGKIVDITVPATSVVAVTLK
jgi:hypothetical protein